VYGLVRRSSVEKFDRLGPVFDRLQLVEGDLTDQSSLDNLVREIQPDESLQPCRAKFCPDLMDAAGADG